MSGRARSVHVDAQAIARHRTAIRRYRCSRPISLALNDGLITSRTSVLDYGCGRGGDLRYLQKRDIRAEGWDPHYRPEVVVKPADVVNLAYVLNVIEDTEERRAALESANELALEVLIIAVRVDRSLENATDYGDGYITNAGTFQKIFSQKEFCEYVESTLSRRTYVAGLGIVYVFKADDAESHYLATRAFTRRLEYRPDLTAEFAKSAVARRYIRMANEIGRIPLAEEFKGYARLVDLFGSAHRLERLTLACVNKNAFEGSRSQRREDILLYFAMLRLQGVRPPPFASLPPAVREDIRAIWRSYAAAQKEGGEFLFSLGRSELVQTACTNSPVGKRVADTLYVHRSAEDEMPPLLRLLIFAARRIVGDVEYNIVKFSVDGRAISFLGYKDFDDDPHPPLTHSVRIFLPKTSYDIRDYSSSENPPILHRKDTFVTPSYIHYEKFRQLTEAEEGFGLLSLPTIGYRSAWQQLLSERGLDIRDHKLVNSTDATASLP
jgi:DNA phosphorothioation-associated putative methyltransferase